MIAISKEDRSTRSAVSEKSARKKVNHVHLKDTFLKTEIIEHDSIEIKNVSQTTTITQIFAKLFSRFSLEVTVLCAILIRMMQLLARARYLKVKLAPSYK